MRIIVKADINPADKETFQKILDEVEAWKEKFSLTGLRIEFEGELLRYDGRTGK